MDPSLSNEFEPAGTYLNTATCGLLPARAVAATRRALDLLAAGEIDEQAEWVAEARGRYARLAGVPVERVAVGTSVSVHSGLVASALAPGSEVLTAEGDFSSLVNPFAVRTDLKQRSVPLERLAEAIGPQTALVAVSTVQSADGRVADLAGIREAAARHGARTYLDATQSVGWLPLEHSGFDFVTCAAYKWLLCPRGTAFLTVSEEATEWLTPINAGASAGASPDGSSYGRILLAASAQRFDTSPAFLSYAAAAASLSLVEEIGVAAIGDHDRALARRFEEGVRALGYEPIAGGGSAIVSVPGLDKLVPALSEAGITVAARAGHLRAAFHLYNSAADVDTILSALPAR